MTKKLYCLIIGLFCILLYINIGYAEYEQVTFGHNPQNGELLEWYVIKEDDDVKELLLKESIGTMEINTVDSFASWETSSLYQWLNGTFYETAFSKREKMYMLNVNRTGEVGLLDAGEAHEVLQSTKGTLFEIQDWWLFAEKADESLFSYVSRGQVMQNRDVETEKKEIIPQIRVNKNYFSESSDELSLISPELISFRGERRESFDAFGVCPYKKESVDLLAQYDGLAKTKYADDIAQWNKKQEEKRLEQIRLAAEKEAAEQEARQAKEEAAKQAAEEKARLAEEDTEQMEEETSETKTSPGTEILYGKDIGGSGGPIEVEVKRENGKIIEIEVKRDNNESVDRGKPAIEIMEDKIKEQYGVEVENVLEVEDVSGATITSEAVKKAVKNALESSELGY